MRAHCALLALILGCTPDDEGGNSSGGDSGTSEETSSSSIELVEYELVVEPLTPFNQGNLFNEINSLQLVIEPKIGETLTYEVSNHGSGETDQIDELPELDEAVISLHGYDAKGNLTAYGRSEPIDMDEGEDSIKILVGKIDEMGWLSDLSDRNGFGSLVADGTGRFLLFGGSTGSVSTGTGDCDDTVLALSLSPPTSSLNFENIGAMPEMSESKEAGRCGHSTTLLTGQHNDNGMIFVAGGTTTATASENASQSMFLWDPETDEAIDLVEQGEDLPKEVFHHVAVEDSSGAVILVGGYTETDAGYFQAAGRAYVYDPVNRETDAVSGYPQGDLIAHAAARLGNDGVLACGGAIFAGGYNYSVSDYCELITLGGSDLVAAENLPIPLMFTSMAPLPDGTVLLTGGLTTTEPQVKQGTTLNATGAAYIYDGTSWTPTSTSMNQQRAMHTSVALPDGRVLIVGGTTTGDSWYWDSSDAIACAEIYDPTTDSFTEVDVCDSSSAEASLPEGTALPAIAVDENLGAVILGGFSSGGTPTENVLLLLAPL